MREAEKDLFTVYTLTLDNHANRRLHLKSELSRAAGRGMRLGNPGEKTAGERALEYPHFLDPYERECIRVLQDYLSLSN